MYAFQYLKMEEILFIFFFKYGWQYLYIFLDWSQFFSKRWRGFSGLSEPFLIFEKRNEFSRCE